MPDLIPGSIQCSRCGATKRETNKWWCGWVCLDDPHIVLAPYAVQWHPDAVLCGESCVLKWMSEEMPKLQKDR